MGFFGLQKMWISSLKSTKREFSGTIGVWKVRSAHGDQFWGPPTFWESEPIQFGPKPWSIAIEVCVERMSIITITQLQGILYQLHHLHRMPCQKLGRGFLGFANDSFYSDQLTQNCLVLNLFMLGVGESYWDGAGGYERKALQSIQSSFRCNKIHHDTGCPAPFVEALPVGHGNFPWPW